LPLTQQEISTTKSLTAAAAGAWITKAADDLHETGGIITGAIFALCAHFQLNPILFRMLACLLARSSHTKSLI
jgi:hypothetical protein